MFKNLLMKQIKIAILVVLATMLTACNNNRETTVAEYFNYNDSIEVAGIQMVPIETPYGNFKVWTKRYGNNPKIKILLLHGGPAMTHEYMECFQTFFQREGFEFYEYDQLGSYYSDKPKDVRLWKTERFVEEVEQVRRFIGADSSNFYLVGNSWGGILAMEYALKYQQNLKGKVVANMMASAIDYNKYTEEVLAVQMKPEILKEIREIEAKKEYSNPRYFELLLPNYYTKHICRLEEWPEPLSRSLNHVNNEIYTMMQGPSELGIASDAVLANWDIKERLKEIIVPALMVGAKYDTMDPAAMEEQSKQVQNGRYLYCPNGSHLAMWDDQQVFMQGVIQFIKDVNEGRF